MVLSKELQNMHIEGVQIQTSTLTKIQAITSSYLIKTIYSTSKEARCNSLELLKSSDSSLLMVDFSMILSMNINTTSVRNLQITMTLLAPITKQVWET
ncbi:26467_t:CDS:2 [Gigaspora margarita]|uniref:26467_t:CDS:1 n=1 Tax=Gigaspora margarita TaxID=4874 RepID=A0ABN7UDN2_GIGMA|nr:26467_t:CDS:2 [Gigaspora margarita]